MKNFSFYTLGCRANQAQTEALKGRLAQGQNIIDFDREADICIINTCTVTADADRKSRQAVRKALRLAKKVIVTGCYARLKGDYLKKLFPQIEILEPYSLFPIPYSIPSRVRSNLMIQDGCENFCSYCIVPYARGKIQRKPLDRILKETELLVTNGAREIILTGINLGTWGDLRAVTAALSPIKDLLRIRLSSIEPMYLKKELIDSIVQNKKVCRHLHIPLQSGDDSILSAMDRNYSGSDFLEMVNYIKKTIPECGITTDVIAGFPGEGEKEFQNTLDICKRAGFSRIHIFPYSKREGTKAADLEGQVDPLTIKSRFNELNKLRSSLMKEFSQKYIGKEVEVLVEQKGKGLTDNFIRVSFDDPQNLTGKLHKLILEPQHLPAN